MKHPYFYKTEGQTGPEDKATDSERAQAPGAAANAVCSRAQVQLVHSTS